MTDLATTRGGRVLLAGGLTAAAAATYAVLVGTGPGQHLDELVASWFDPVFTTASGDLPLPLWIEAHTLLAGAVAAIVLIGSVRRVPGRTVAAVLLLGGAVVSAQVLKVVLERTHLTTGTHVTSNSFPSGHVALAAATAVALLMVLPQAARTVVALVGTVWVGAVGVATLVVGWHRPSDIIGAVLIVGAWYALATALFPRGTGGNPSSFLDRRWQGTAIGSAHDHMERIQSSRAAHR